MRQHFVLGFTCCSAQSVANVPLGRLGDASPSDSIRQLACLATASHSLPGPFILMHPDIFFLFFRLLMDMTVSIDQHL